MTRVLRAPGIPWTACPALIVLLLAGIVPGAAQAGHAGEPLGALDLLPHELLVLTAALSGAILLLVSVALLLLWIVSRRLLELVRRVEALEHRLAGQPRPLS